MALTDKKYLDLISREPLPDMVTEVKNKEGELEYKYIKKSILQKELLTIFNGHTKWEMLRDSITKSGLWGTGILHYKHPATGEWLFVTGTASLPHEKKMRLNFPNLESHCFLNAVKKIGVWFGQTLNQKEEDEIPEYKEDQEPTPEEQSKNLSQQILQCQTLEDLKSYRLLIYAKGVSGEIQSLYETRLRQIKNQKPSIV